MLRTSFPVNIRSNQVHCEIQFGSLGRPTHRNTLWDFAKDEICAHQWVDLSEPDYGVALLNDCKYGHRAIDNVLDLNLLRSSTYPDPEADRAEHRFTYSLYPHQGNHVQAEIYRRGYELNVPLRTMSLPDVSDQETGSCLYPKLSQPRSSAHHGGVGQKPRTATISSFVCMKLQERMRARRCGLDFKPPRPGSPI